MQPLGHALQLPSRNLHRLLGGQRTPSSLSLHPAQVLQFLEGVGVLLVTGLAGHAGRGDVLSKQRRVDVSSKFRARTSVDPMK